MSMHGFPNIADNLHVIKVRGDGMTEYDSEKDPKRKQPTFDVDPEPLKFCPNCGADTLPIIFVCKACGKRFVKQVEKTTGKRLIIVLEDQENTKPPTQP